MSVETREHVDTFRELIDEVLNAVRFVHQRSQRGRIAVAAAADRIWHDSNSDFGGSERRNLSRIGAFAPGTKRPKRNRRDDLCGRGLFDHCPGTYCREN
jgi:hypothetical protein